MKTLVAVDGSETATKALERALGMLGPEVHYVVVEVIDPVDRVNALRSAAFNPDLVQAALRDLREDAEQHVAAADTHLTDAGAKHVESSVLEGRAGEVLVDYAQQ